MQPSGHQATRHGIAHGCLLNHAAGAAAHLRSHGSERVAVLDLDAAHGGGTRSIFWNDPDVLTVSLDAEVDRPAEGDDTSTALAVTNCR